MTQVMILFATLLGYSNTVAAAEDVEEIITDRPDFVNSATVVGRGQFQIENGISIKRDRTGSQKARTITTPALLRIGAGQAWEIRLESDGRTLYRTRDTTTGAQAAVSGYSDLSVGTKWHVTDGKGVLPAFALLGNVMIDSGSKPFRGSSLRPSFQVAAEWELSRDVSLGIMPGVTYDKDADGGSFYAGMFGIVLGKSWTDRFRTFIEIAAPQIAPAGHGGTVATFDLGAAYLLSKQWQLDTALFRGLNSNTEDLTLALGISTKF